MSYKLVAIIQNSTSLGSILMTDGVNVISIETMTGKNTKKESISLPKRITVNKKSGNRFKHLSGKTTADFILEYLQNHSIGRWVDIKIYIIKQGFSRATINNGIQTLLKTNQIIRVEIGRYALNQNQKNPE